MAVRIHRRKWLLTLIGAAQLGCLLLGEAWYITGLRTRLHAELERHVDLDNRLAVDHAAQLLLHSYEATADIDERDVAHLAEELRPPQDGCLSVLRSRSGEVIGQVSVHTSDRVAAASLSSAVVSAPRGQCSVRDLHLSESHEFVGLAEIGGERWRMSLRRIPALGLDVLALHSDREITARVRQTLGAVHAIGLLIAFVVAALGVLLAALIVQRYESQLMQLNDRLSDLAETRARSLVKARDAMIFGLAKLAESRDDDTGEHLDRIRAYVEVLAREMSLDHPELSPDYVRRLGLTSSLHDIGKVGIPDAVLCKPGRLTEDERRIIEQHPLIGGACLQALRRRLDDDDGLIDLACEIAMSHHERWDGTGYPRGLREEQIPLSARIVALADVYDALTTRRVYKPAMSHQRAMRIIIQGAGAQFDPQVVEAFVRRQEEFRAAAERHGVLTDPEPERVRRVLALAAAR